MSGAQPRRAEALPNAHSAQLACDGSEWPTGVAACARRTRSVLKDPSALANVPGGAGPVMNDNDTRHPCSVVASNQDPMDAN